jgi:hypothetical protein
MSELELKLDYDDLDLFGNCRGTRKCLARTKGHGGNRLGGYKTTQASGYCERRDRASVPDSPAAKTRTLRVPVPEQRDYACDKA